MLPNDDVSIVPTEWISSTQYGTPLYLQCLYTWNGCHLYLRDLPLTTTHTGDSVQMQYTCAQSIASKHVSQCLHKQLATSPSILHKASSNIQMSINTWSVPSHRSRTCAITCHSTIAKKTRELKNNFWFNQLTQNFDDIGYHTIPTVQHNTESHVIDQTVQLLEG